MSNITLDLLVVVFVVYMSITIPWGIINMRKADFFGEVVPWYRRYIIFTAVTLVIIFILIAMMFIGEALHIGV